MTITTHSTMPATALRHDATARHHVHMTHYVKAMGFIQAHGHFAAITRDGLLALSDVCRCVPDDGFTAHGADDDRWLEVPKLFEVDEDGMVSSREVRQWLGY